MKDKLKNILIVGDFRNSPAEGMEVITSAFTNRCSDSNFNILNLSQKKIFFNFFKIILFKPDLAIFTHGPGPGTLLITRVLNIFLNDLKIVWIATRPNLDNIFSSLLINIKVEHIYSSQNNKNLNDFAYKREIMSSNEIIGIDFSRFSSLGVERNDIFKQYFSSIEYFDEMPNLLHVGHVRNNRGLEELIKIKKNIKFPVNILVIASKSLDYDKGLLDELVKNKVSVHRGFISDISSIYKAADLYLFPPDPILKGAIDLPLSVIESLALKTPVISTYFGSLNKYLSNFNGIKFCKKDQFADFVISILETEPNITVDELPYRFNINNLIDKVVKNHVY